MGLAVGAVAAAVGAAFMAAPRGSSCDARNGGFPLLDERTAVVVVVGAAAVFGAAAEVVVIVVGASGAGKVPALPPWAW